MDLLGIEFMCMKNFVGTLQSNGNSFYADNKSIIRRKKIWEIESVFLLVV